MKYELKIISVLALIVFLLGVAWKNIQPGRAEPVLPTVLPSSTPVPTATQTALTPSPATTSAAAVTENTPAPWSPNHEEAQHFQRQCVAANGVMEENMHEVVVGQVVFLPDYSAAETAPSCNNVTFGENQPTAIVLHFTGGSLAASLSWFRKLDGASAHYLIDRDGTVVQLIPELVGAKHVSCAGGSCLASCPDYLCSDGYPELRSVGIELVNWGYVDPTESGILVYEDYLAAFGRRYWEDYSDFQLQSLKALICDIARRWSIPIDQDHILGHYRVNQKLDPGPALNLFWERIGTPYHPPLLLDGCE